MMFNRKPKKSSSRYLIMYVLNQPYKTWALVNSVSPTAQVDAKQPVYVLDITYYPEEGWYARVWQEHYTDGDQPRFVPLNFLVSSEEVKVWEMQV